MKKGIQLVALLLTVVMSSCTGGKDKAAVKQEDEKPRVKVADVTARPVDQIQDYTATVEAEVKNNIAPSSPVRIDRILVEVGDRVSKGQKLVQMDVKGSPVKDAYLLCFAEGDPDGRMSWDLTAVLVAVKGYEPYYNVERGTFRVVNDGGANSWTPDGKGRDLRLIEKVPAAEMAVLIENYMMHQPVSK